MHHSTGPTLVGIGGLHTVVGVVGYRPQLAAIARDGVVDAVDPYADRQTAFWFALTGVTFMLWATTFAGWSAHRAACRLPCPGNSLASGRLASS